MSAVSTPQTTATAAESVNSGPRPESILNSGLLSALMGSAFGGSVLGGSSAGASYGVNAAGMAAGMAAQSLLKAYSKVNSTPQSGSYSGSQSAQSGAAAGTSGTAAAQKSAVDPAGYSKITSSVGNRSAETYRAVLDSLEVETNPRYAVNQKGTGDTYCNVYMLDATEAMGAAIPRYTDKTTGAPSNRKNDNAIAMNANRISDWLNKHGSNYGWYEVTAEQAQALANKGCPAVTTWRNNSGGHGHVQVVSPSKDGKYDAERGVAIAQAGRNLRNYTYITNIYSSRMKDVQYFAHV